MMSSITFVLVMILLSSMALVATASSSPATPFGTVRAAAATTLPAYEITTRGVLGKPWEAVNNESGYTGTYQLLDIKDLFNSCPEEVAIVVHGWYLDENEAKERFDRVKLSLENNNYSIPIVGFSWDSHKNWSEAKSMAKENGPKLADFIFNLENTCMQQPHNKEVKIRLLGHSLGSRVILSALDSLHNNSAWNINNYKIESVHLMAAAVDNEEVSKNQQDILNDPTNWNTLKTTAYGQAIDQEVRHFYNLYNTQDNALEPNPIYPFYPYQVYPSYEGDWALGQSGYQTIPYDIFLSLPANYAQINVQYEILPICDADGDKKPDIPLAQNMAIKIGDNHGGYFGFRDSANKTKLVDDGAINVVVKTWENLPPITKSPAQLTGICS